MKHIFVLAMDDLHRAELETICEADTCCFHPVMDVDSLVDAKEVHFDALLGQVRDIIMQAGVPVDGIIAQWDFPTSLLVPALCEEFGLPSPSLVSVLKCEHKYWSRLEQVLHVPDVVPDFCSFDPFSEHPLAGIHLDYPFWIKPVKGFSSQLGFLIRNEEEFQHALGLVREGIGRLGSAFEEVLQRVDLPPLVGAAGARICLAEEIIEGFQIAPEGYVQNGQVHIHGYLDMNRVEMGTGFDRLVYPSRAPDYVKDKIRRTCEQLLQGIGFDNGCFNAEFMWDEARNRLRLIEVNTRISQSHSEMFLQVDGRSNHEIAVSVALGQAPRMPCGEGPYQIAAKFLITHPEDGVVTRVPDEAEIAALKREFPLMQTRLYVQPGTRLGDMPNQDSYRFTLGEIYLGASDHNELMERFNRCVAALQPGIASPEDGELIPDNLQSEGASDDVLQPVSPLSADRGKHLHTDV